MAPSLVLGPILRFVDESRATIWVETDQPCDVTVETAVGVHATAETWGVGGHHFALVAVRDLPADTLIDYSVRLGVRGDEPVDVWPPADVPCHLRTSGADRRPSIAFGSCRRGENHDSESLARVGADALTGLAARVRTEAVERHPDLLLFLGDQVYADDPSREVLAHLRRHRAAHSPDPDLTTEVRDEICDFEEYTWLYHESWGSPAVRGLMACVPSCMILDDHDLRDDWNSSWSWRQETSAKPWWRRRVIGAFTSYWIYQHLGNLDPDMLDREHLYSTVRFAVDDDERERILADFAVRADAEPSTARWSFVRDLGPLRLVMIDSRCSRELTPDRRGILDDAEWKWVVQAATERPARHLVFGTSLPYLMLPALHHLEQWDEAVAQGAWGRLGARVGEKARLALDLEHWGAFDASFRDMARLVADLSDGPQAPASVTWVSGDVHCSYIAEAQLTDGARHGRTGLFQLTMSPFRNPLERPVRVVNRLAVRKPLVRLMRRLARSAGVADLPVEWDTTAGPWFDNGVMTLAVDGDDVTVRVEHAFTAPDGTQRLSSTHQQRLTPQS
ncbi:alkaline phosphatase D family protein [Williamsia deligens]|uniref:Alkaline phosphatase D family protein n=1 Tax=Williamsia deligens TaxID=321325 RepID=A0ABW3G555_9NOCA|nr:alkaline phosphatase D family protein [Williamsia deligens]MCP2193649.1 PhoD-like phosphatase [Williamsia deligens]